MTGLTARMTPSKTEINDRNDRLEYIESMRFTRALPHLCFSKSLQALHDRAALDEQQAAENVLVEIRIDIFIDQNPSWDDDPKKLRVYAYLERIYSSGEQFSSIENNNNNHRITSSSARRLQRYINSRLEENPKARLRFNANTYRDYCSSTHLFFTEAFK